MKVRRIAIALSALALMSLLGGIPTASAATAPYCGITWGSLQKTLLQGTRAPISNLRTGQHDCWDRLVFDVAGSPAPGYDVEYRDWVGHVVTGSPMTVTGGAILSIRMFAPNQITFQSPNAVPPEAFTAADYRTFRHLVYLGSDGWNTGFGLGVRARLPFRVFSLAGPGGGTRLVIDVAHQW